MLKIDAAEIKEQNYVFRNHSSKRYLNLQMGIIFLGVSLYRVRIICIMIRMS